MPTEELAGAIAQVPPSRLWSAPARAAVGLDGKGCGSRTCSYRSAELADCRHRDSGMVWSSCYGAPTQSSDSSIWAPVCFPLLLFVLLSLSRKNPAVQYNERAFQRPGKFLATSRRFGILCSSPQQLPQPISIIEACSGRIVTEALQKLHAYDAQRSFN